MNFIHHPSRLKGARIRIIIVRMQNSKRCLLCNQRNRENWIQLNKKKYIIIVCIYIYWNPQIWRYLPTNMVILFVENCKKITIDRFEFVECTYYLNCQFVSVIRHTIVWTETFQYGFGSCGALYLSLSVKIPCLNESQPEFKSIISIGGTHANNWHSYCSTMDRTDHGWKNKRREERKSSKETERETP